MTNGPCKLCRVLDRWGFDGHDDRLLREWRGVDGSRKGYRTLARETNVTLLRREMDRAGLPTLAAEPESKYDRLTGDDDTLARETRRLLEQGGVPIDRLESDFVSYSVVRTHLISCLGAEYEPPERSDSGSGSASRSDGQWTTESVRIARETAAKKTEAAVRALVNREELRAGGDLAVDVRVTVACPVCDTRVDFQEAAERGYVCDCPVVDTEEDSTSDPDDTERG